MPLTVSGNIKVGMTWSEALSAGVNSGTYGGALNISETFAAGTGGNAMNEVWTKSATLAISTPVTHTLSNLADDLGRTIPLAKVRLMAICNDGTAVLLVGGAAANPWGAIVGDAATDKLKVPPGGFIIIGAPELAGLAVGVGASDQLKLDPGATACPYRLVFFGEA